jgi:hypothetical protein
MMLSALIIVLCSASPGMAQLAGNKFGQATARNVSRTVVQPVVQQVEQPAGMTNGQTSGQAVARSVGHRHCCNRPEVFLLRGGAGYWPKVSQFEEVLRTRGFEPRTIYHWEHRGLADEIASAYRAGELAGPVTIVGYSSGADAACWMSERLNKAGVPVTNLILIESTFGIDVPTNVSFCYNIYQSRWADAVPAFRGIAVNAQNPNTQLFNVDVRYHPELAVFAERGHFTMASASPMHNYLSDLLAQRVFQPQTAAQPNGEGEESSEGSSEGPAQEASRPNAGTVRK